jgi:hypothetical protein
MSKRIVCFSHSKESRPWGIKMQTLANSDHRLTDVLEEVGHHFRMFLDSLSGLPREV